MIPPPSSPHPSLLAPNSPSFHLENIIALEQTLYTVGEGDGIVTVCAVIASGELVKGDMVEISSQDNTATGAYYPKSITTTDILADTYSVKIVTNM